jgi:hypothetical protein
VGGRPDSNDTAGADDEDEADADDDEGLDGVDTTGAVEAEEDEVAGADGWTTVDSKAGDSEILLVSVNTASAEALVSGESLDSEGAVIAAAVSAAAASACITWLNIWASGSCDDDDDDGVPSSELLAGSLNGDENKSQMR